MFGAGSRPLSKAVYVILLALVVLPLRANAAESDIAKEAEAGEYLSAPQLYDLFYGRTWRWGPDKGGFYSNVGRQFLAYSGAGATRSYAEGNWFITSDGRVCTRAVWHSTTWVGKVQECLQHKTDGRRIFQRKMPKGDWYVFKNTPMKSGDVYGQFVVGDRVSAGYNKNKQFVDSLRKK